MNHIHHDTTCPHCGLKYNAGIAALFGGRCPWCDRKPGDVAAQAEPDIIKAMETETTEERNRRMLQPMEKVEFRLGLIANRLRNLIDGQNPANYQRTVLAVVSSSAPQAEDIKSVKTELEERLSKGWAVEKTISVGPVHYIIFYRRLHWVDYEEGEIVQTEYGHGKIVRRESTFPHQQVYKIELQDGSLIEAVETDFVRII